MNAHDPSFGPALLAHRTRLNYTQPEAATLLGVTIRTYWRWEHGMACPIELAIVEALRRLAAAPVFSACRQ